MLFYIREKVEYTGAEKQKIQEEDTVDKNRHQTSETFRLSALLALSGGFQDAYTYNVRDGVFSNAQTGNVVLMSQNLMMGQWKNALHYLFPVVTFALGVLVAEGIHWRYQESKRFHWRQIVVALEIAVLLLAGFIPESLNMAATMLVSFSCAMQVQTFRKVHGYGYASTMCIGNLRSGTESLAIYFRERQAGALKKALHYYGIIFVFAVGAGLGGIVSVSVGLPAIWVSPVLLTAAFLLMNREKM